MGKLLTCFLLILPTLYFGVYFTDVTENAITVNWITDQEADASIFVRDTEGRTVYTETRASFSSLHSFRIEGLSAGEEYTYGLHSFGEDYSFTYAGSFRTAPERGTPFVFAVYGDNRNGPHIHSRIIDMIAGHNPSLVINTGDMVYHDSHVDEWLEFFDTISTLEETVYFPVVGNHEKDAINYGRFFNPPGNGRFYHFWYSDILYIVLNTNERFDNWSEQYRWLRSTLETETAKEPAFIVVSFHHTAYSFGFHGDHRYIKEYIVPVLEEFGVDVVLNGHDHAYQRIERGGITYLVTAGGGAPLYSLKEGDESLVAAVRAHHFVLVRYEDSMLFFESIDVDGEVIDTFVLRPRRQSRSLDILFCFPSG